MAGKLAVATLAGVTVVVALVSEVFVGTLQEAATAFGHDTRLRGLRYCRPRRRRGGDGVGVCRRAQGPARSQRRHRTWQRLTDRIVCCAGTGVLLSYVLGQSPMDLQFWPGAMAMMLIATVTALLVTNSGRSAWFVGVLVLVVHLTFAVTLYSLPPKIG